MFILKRICFAALCVILATAVASCSLFPKPTTENPTTHSATTQEETTPATEKIITGTIINAPGQVNIRSEPNSKCEILGTAYNGEIFVVLKAFFSPSWHQIAYKGETAYIYIDYFQINDNSVIVTTESSAFSPFITTTIAPTTAITPTTSIKPTATAAPTTAITPTTSTKPTATIAPTTTVRPTTSVSATTVGSSDYGYVVRNREQILGMMKILMLNLQSKILFDLRSCDSSYKEIQSIISEASAKIELETGIADIEDKYAWEYANGQMTINIDYEYTRAQLDAAISKAKSVVDGILKDGANKSAYEKELAIHDYIVNNTAYDLQRFNNKTEPIESHTAYGSLVLGIAVCEGYAEAMNLLCYYAGIECLEVLGYAGGDHVWNIVYVDDAYYQVDATWDDPTSDDGVQTLKHWYFNITDAKMALDHTWTAANYPKCVSMTCNYYYMKGLVVKNIDELKARLQNVLSNKQSGIELLLEGYTKASYENVKAAIYDNVYAKGSAATNYWYNIKDSGIINVYGIEYK